MTLDEIDRQIVDLLRQHARLSYADVGKQVALSASQCHRRVRALEQAGVIAGYHAAVDRAALGYPLDIWVSVHLRIDDSSTLAAFEETVRETAEIVECHCLLGEPDYLLRVSASDLDTYRQFHADVLGQLPGIARITSHVRVRAVKE